MQAASPSNTPRQLEGSSTGSNAIGIIPALESSHAVAHALITAREMGTGTVLVNLSGRGDKDMVYRIENWGIGQDRRVAGGLSGAALVTTASHLLLPTAATSTVVVSTILKSSASTTAESGSTAGPAAFAPGGAAT